LPHFQVALIPQSLPRAQLMLDTMSLPSILRFPEIRNRIELALEVAARSKIPTMRSALPICWALLFMFGICRLNFKKK
jgi:hypothetical protein